MPLWIVTCKKTGNQQMIEGDALADLDQDWPARHNFRKAAKCSKTGKHLDTITPDMTIEADGTIDVSPIDADQKFEHWRRRNRRLARMIEHIVRREIAEALAAQK